MNEDRLDKAYADGWADCQAALLTRLSEDGGALLAGYEIEFSAPGMPS